MTRQDDQNTRFRVAHLSTRQPTPFTIAPDAEARAALATELDLIALPALRFTGQITAVGRDAWRLSGRITAKVVQPCVVTLAQVTTAINEEVRRDYSPHVIQPEAEEIEIPEDDLEPLGQFIDVRAVMVEALSLALPLYPRLEGAELAAQPAAPEEESDTRRPLAGLADLMKKPS